jgi:hypothetical protein
LPEVLFRLAARISRVSPLLIRPPEALLIAPPVMGQGLFAVTADRAGAVVETGGRDAYFAEAADAALAVVEQRAAEVDGDVAELAGDRAFQAVVEGAAAEALGLSSRRADRSGFSDRPP